SVTRREGAEVETACTGHVHRRPSNARSSTSAPYGSVRVWLQGISHRRSRRVGRPSGELDELVRDRYRMSQHVPYRPAGASRVKPQLRLRDLGNHGRLNVECLKEAADVLPTKAARVFRARTVDTDACPG